MLSEIDEQELLLKLEKEYFEKFGEEPPCPPMLISPLADWYFNLLTKAIKTNKPLTVEEMDEYLEKHNIIRHDVIY